MSRTEVPDSPASGAGDSLDAATHNPIAAPSTRRLAPLIGLNSLALFATINGTWLVLLPSQIGHIDPVHKVTNLALINLVTLVFTVVVQPIVGTFSDRTRTPLGRRSPWMIGAAALVLVALLVLGYVPTLGLIIVFWALAQIGLQALSAPLTAIIPDRYPRAKRGIPSSMVGFGTLVGAGMGAVLAGTLVTTPAVGYTIFGIAVFVATALFILLNRDRSSADLENPPLSAREFFTGFWVSPRKDPDFAWAFASRFVFYLGFFSLFAIQFYVAEDFLHLSPAAAGAQVSINQGAALPFMIVSVIVSGWLSDRLRQRKIFIYLSAILVVIGFAELIVVPTPMGSTIQMIVLGTAFGLYLSCDTALLTEVLPGNGKDAAKDLGILNIATSLPQALATGVSAIILTVFGNPAGYIPLLIFGMVCAVISIGLLAPVRSVK